jgi:hypothetical protein
MIGFSRDTRARTSFIESFAPSKLSMVELVTRFPSYQDDWKSTAVLSCLANQGAENDDPQWNRQYVDLVMEAFESHPSSGVHTASRLLLSSWGYSDYVRTRQDSVAFQEVRTDRSWFVNSLGMQMTIVQAPTTFWLGPQPRDLSVPPTSPQVGWRSIEESYAISEAPITAKAVYGFLGLEAGDMTKLDWFRAKEFCEWLTWREELPISIGYDVVSLDEWECAVRAQTINNLGVVAYPGNERERERGIFHPLGLSQFGKITTDEWTRTIFDPLNDKNDQFRFIKPMHQEGKMPYLSRTSFVSASLESNGKAKSRVRTRGVVPSAFRYVRPVPK